MSTLALNIRMQGKIAVIIGGGAVALRKLRTLLAAGASVRMVAPDINPDITALQGGTSLEVRLGAYRESDLKGAFLVIAATDNQLVNEQISAAAEARGVLVASADRPELGNCTFPALLRRGKLEIAVSTGGGCPTFAADVRDKIAENIGPEYAAILEQLAEEREKLLTNGSPSTYNTQVLRSLASHLVSELTERKELLP